MKSVRNFFVAASLISLIISVPARAETDAGTIISQIDSGNMRLVSIIKAYSIGMDWANSALEFKKSPKLYCPPANLAITADQNLDILKRFVAKSPDAARKPAGLALLIAYQDAFPCEPTP